MRVLHVIPSLDPIKGGVRQALLLMLKGMENTCIKNEILCCDAPDTDFITNFSNIIYAVGPTKTSWSYTAMLDKWLKKNISNYDIIIVHGLWQYQSRAIYKARKRFKKPPKLYIMPHGMLDPYFQKAKTRYLKAIRNIFVWHIIEKRFINSADALLFTCEDEKISARETFNSYYPKKEIVIGLGIEAPATFRANMKETFEKKHLQWNGAPFFLFLSRIDEKKGLDMLIKAYNLLNNKYEKLPQLVIAGPGIETSYGQKILNLSRSNKNIIFCGMLYGDEKWAAFYNCEVFILPSHQENFGIVIAESLACGKAVLITDKVNIWREIEKNNVGLITSDTDTGIYNMMEKWLHTSQKKRDIMEICAKETFEQNFSIDITTKRLINILTLN